MPRLNFASFDLKFHARILNGMYKQTRRLLLFFLSFFFQARFGRLNILSDRFEIGHISRTKRKKRKTEEEKKKQNLIRSARTV